ncbi:hypothetical protein [Hyphococcus luteus]|uniref:Uncharacterized protein n=1 Tax=Hyphococcus luteus TaxID=2058213 RepID=A0A2S7JZZ7_9PROT|nr:hypothetical protein [Marinicaulis flavus]PQA85820.1 hypothetical protein CW354_19950 [Marinicaulis flavus]
MSDQHEHHSGEEGWADKKSFRNAFLGVLVVASILAAVAGFVPAWRKEHPHFPAEEFGVFFAVWGFAAFMFIVLAGQHLRKLVGRKEDYYEERE